MTPRRAELNCRDHRGPRLLPGADAERDARWRLASGTVVIAGDGRDEELILEATGVP